VSVKLAAPRVGSARLEQEHRVVFSICRFLFQVVLQPAEMLQHSGCGKWRGRRCSQNTFNFTDLFILLGKKVLTVLNVFK